LSICIVFVPVVFLTGAVQSLFTPLAMAVVVAMMASYLLSRTLIPTLVRYLLQSEVRMCQHADGDHGTVSYNFIWKIHHRFNRRFEWFRGRYRNTLA
jgi:multidrug efflux pump subunit AcrB